MDIEITVPINAELLQEELEAQFPGYEFYIEQSGGQTWLGGPDALDPTAVQAVIDAHDAGKPTKADKLQAAIFQLAQSSVGVRINDLTALQVRALVAVLMRRAGAIDPDDLTIRPLAEWAQ